MPYIPKWSYPRPADKTRAVERGGEVIFAGSRWFLGIGVLTILWTSLAIWTAWSSPNRLLMSSITAPFFAMGLFLILASPKDITISAEGLAETSMIGRRPKHMSWQEVDHAVTNHELVPVRRGRTVASTKVFVIGKTPGSELEFGPYHSGRTRFIQELERHGVEVHREEGEPRKAVYGPNPLDL